MKRNINGKIYDTRNAKLVAEYTNGLYPDDFDYLSEDLYRTADGEYFIDGEGGAHTSYAVAVGQNSWSGGERITPLSYAEAQKWAEEHLGGEEYDKIFGAVDDSDEKRTVAIRLTAGSAEKLKCLAAQAGTNASEIIEKLIAKA